MSARVKRSVKPKPMGRPPLSPEGPKGAVLILRLSAREKSAIETAAAASGKSTSAWARQVLLAEARRQL